MGDSTDHGPQSGVTRRSVLGGMAGAGILAMTEAGGAAAAAGIGPGGGPGADPAPELTGNLFAAPPSTTRPKYRWWMPLAYTDDAELAAELAQMREAGAGGAEVAAFGVAGSGNDQNPFLEQYGFGTPKWT
ncbi:hypothetical protein [Amycolatopsis sp. NBC_01480]|uniref:hypothetical protein n=1 Tax=Amycolatopsis sp. NBC_01480 TaxID=2903562 RepID=UPI002E2C16AA|nr:hypothetical protein [Amycolatopsis sp. NBC_01480]